MTDSVTHPSLDVLADHHEGLLPAADAMRVNGHLAGCEECRGFVDALDDVRSALQEVGTATMPATVASRLDAALAVEARERAGSGRIERHRRRGRLLVAAAAVGVLAVGGVVAGSLASRDRGSSGSSAGGATNERASSSAGLGSSGTNSKSSNARAGEPMTVTGISINQENFASIAPLAVTFGPAALGTSQSCLAEAVPGYRPSRWASTQVRWLGKPAWLAVDLSGAEGYVVSCTTSPRVLYHHKF